MVIRAGKGMKNKSRLGIRCQIIFNYRSGTGPRKTLPKSTRLTGKVIHINKWFRICLLQHQIFHGHRIFQHLYPITNQYCLWGWQVPQLTSYPTLSGLVLRSKYPYPELDPSRLPVPGLTGNIFAAITYKRW